MDHKVNNRRYMERNKIRPDDDYDEYVDPGFLKYDLKKRADESSTTTKKKHKKSTKKKGTNKSTATSTATKKKKKSHKVRDEDDLMKIMKKKMKMKLAKKEAVDDDEDEYLEEVQEKKVKKSSKKDLQDSATKKKTKKKKKKHLKEKNGKPEKSKRPKEPKRDMPSERMDVEDSEDDDEVVVTKKKRKSKKAKEEGSTKKEKEKKPRKHSTKEKDSTTKKKKKKSKKPKDEKSKKKRKHKKSSHKRHETGEQSVPKAKMTASEVDSDEQDIITSSSTQFDVANRRPMTGEPPAPSCCSDDDSGEDGVQRRRRRVGQKMQAAMAMAEDVVTLSNEPNSNLTGDDRQEIYALTDPDEVLQLSEEVLRKVGALPPPESQPDIQLLPEPGACIGTSHGPRSPKKILDPQLRREYHNFTVKPVSSKFGLLQQWQQKSAVREQALAVEQEVYARHQEQMVKRLVSRSRPQPERVQHDVPAQSLTTEQEHKHRTPHAQRRTNVSINDIANDTEQQDLDLIINVKKQTALAMSKWMQREAGADDEAEDSDDGKPKRRNGRPNALLNKWKQFEQARIEGGEDAPDGAPPAGTSGKKNALLDKWKQREKGEGDDSGIATSSSSAKSAVAPVNIVKGNYDAFLKAREASRRKGPSLEEIKQKNKQEAELRKRNAEAAHAEKKKAEKEREEADNSRRDTEEAALKEERRIRAEEAKRLQEEMLKLAPPAPTTAENAEGAAAATPAVEEPATPLAPPPDAPPPPGAKGDAATPATPAEAAAPASAPAAETEKTDAAPAEAAAPSQAAAQ